MLDVTYPVLVESCQFEEKRLLACVRKQHLAIFPRPLMHAHHGGVFRVHEQTHILQARPAAEAVGATAVAWTADEAVPGVQD